MFHQGIMTSQRTTHFQILVYTTKVKLVPWRLNYLVSERENPTLLNATNSSQKVRFQVLTVTCMIIFEDNRRWHTTDFWDVGPCVLVETDRRFRDAYCFHHRRWSYSFTYVYYNFDLARCEVITAKIKFVATFFFGLGPPNTIFILLETKPACVQTDGQKSPPNYAFISGTECVCVCARANMFLDFLYHARFLRDIQL
jgi:hypothetical protein